jgi:hypothetical protein
MAGDSLSFVPLLLLLLLPLLLLPLFVGTSTGERPSHELILRTLPCVSTAAMTVAHSTLNPTAATPYFAGEWARSTFDRRWLGHATFEIQNVFFSHSSVPYAGKCTSVGPT